MYEYIQFDIHENKIWWKNHFAVFAYPSEIRRQILCWPLPSSALVYVIILWHYALIWIFSPHVCYQHSTHTIYACSYIDRPVFIYLSVFMWFWYFPYLLPSFAPLLHQLFAAAPCVFIVAWSVTTAFFLVFVCFSYTRIRRYFSAYSFWRHIHIRMRNRLRCFIAHYLLNHFYGKKSVYVYSVVLSGANEVIAVYI